jgi:hypothetical protein
MLKVAGALLLVLSASAAVKAATVSPEELQKQNEFKKAMSSPERIDHMKALALLEGATHPSSAELLSLVIQVNPNKEVRLAAYKALSQMPSPDQRLATVLLNHFKNIKPNDMDERLEFAEQMKNSEFKYLIFETLSDWGTKLRYPDLLTNYNNNNSGNAGGNGTIGGDPNFGIKKQRAAFEKFAKVYNTVTGAKITATDREAPLQCRTWWAENKDKTLAADKALLEKYKAEELEQRTKANTLGPKPAEKADKAEKVEKAEKPKVGNAAE